MENQVNQILFERLIPIGSWMQSYAFKTNNYSVIQIPQLLDIWKTLLRDIVNIIIKFDGKVVYFKGNYFDINKIKKSDYRYVLLRPIILKKTDICLNTECYDKKNFFFEYEFDGMPQSGLVYDLGFSREDVFRICYYDLRNDRNDGVAAWLQIKTYI